MLGRSLSSSSFSGFSSSTTAPQETPASADIGRPLPQKCLQVLKKDLVLCEEEEFFGYFKELGVSPDTNFLVLSAIGGYAGGKSTLLNHLFFRSNNVFDTVNRDGISGLTIGMNIALVKFNYFDRQTEPVYLLIVDSEGVSSPTENSLDCAFLLSLRLLLISDAMIHNSTSSLQRSEFMPLNEASSRLFQNKLNRPDVNLVFFIQRANLFYQRAEDLHQFFPQQALPKWFPNFGVATSRDKIRGDDEGVRLELDDLKAKLVASLTKIPKTSARSLWSNLKHLDENLPTPKPNESIEESFTGCRTECAHCRARCTRDRFWRHEHENYSSECPASKVISHKCRKCITSQEPVRTANAEFTYFTLRIYKGPLWYCNNTRMAHGELAHRYAWGMMPPFRHDDPEYKQYVMEHKEHQFGPLVVATEKAKAPEKKKAAAAIQDPWGLVATVTQFLGTMVSNWLTPSV